MGQAKNLEPVIREHPDYFDFHGAAEQAWNEIKHKYEPLDEILLFIVFDQMHWRYLDRVGLDSLPLIGKISSGDSIGYEKARSKKYLQIRHLPAVTAVGHADLSTGAVPRYHGVVANCYDGADNVDVPNRYRGSNHINVRTIGRGTSEADRRTSISQVLWDDTLGELLHYKGFLTAALGGKNYSTCLVGGKDVDFLIFPMQEVDTEFYLMTGVHERGELHRRGIATPKAKFEEWSREQHCRGPKMLDVLTFLSALEIIKYTTRPEIELKRKLALFVTFSTLDRLGHLTGPGIPIGGIHGSDIVIQYVADRANALLHGLFLLVDNVFNGSLDTLHIVITSDHGAHHTTRRIHFDRGVNPPYIGYDAPHFRIGYDPGAMEIGPNDMGIIYVPEGRLVDAETALTGWLSNSAIFRCALRENGVRVTAYDPRTGGLIDPCPRCEHFVSGKCSLTNLIANYCQNTYRPVQFFLIPEHELSLDSTEIYHGFHGTLGARKTSVSFGDHGSPLPNEDNLKIPLFLYSRRVNYGNINYQDEIAKELWRGNWAAP